MSKTYHPPLLGNPRLGFRFGQLYPRNPIFGSLQGQRHLGQDYLVPVGTPVYAIDNGTLAYSTGRQGGITVNLVTDDGLSVRYMHLSRYADRSKTRAVRGEIIAYSGNTGVSNSGGHLHADIYNGRITIPTRFAMFIDPLSLKYSTEQPTIKPNEKPMADKQVKFTGQAYITRVCENYEILIEYARKAPLFLLHRYKFVDGDAKWNGDNFRKLPTESWASDRTKEQFRQAIEADFQDWRRNQK